MQGLSVALYKYCTPIFIYFSGFMVPMAPLYYQDIEMLLCGGVIMWSSINQLQRGFELFC